MAPINDFMGNKLLFLKTIRDTNKNLPENSKENNETFYDNIGYNTAMSGAPTTMKENGVPSTKGTILLVMGGARPIPWLARSKHFISGDFCFWGHVNDQVRQP
jgi:hypothetical protein